MEDTSVWRGGGAVCDGASLLRRGGEMSEAFQCNSVSDGGDGCRLDLALGKLNSCQVWFRMAGDEVREGGVARVCTEDCLSFLNLLKPSHLFWCFSTPPSLALNDQSMISLNLIPPLMITEWRGSVEGVCVCVLKGEKEHGGKEECGIIELITALSGRSAAYAVILSCPCSPALANTATYSCCN